MQTMTGACWPTPFAERLLRACFGPVEPAPDPSACDLPRDDPAASVLLPLLDWHFGSRLSAELAEEARLKRLAYWRQSRHRLEEAVGLAEVLRPAGIEPVFLKGTALVAQYYPDPSLRGVGDVDFMVPRDRVSAAVDALVQAGWSPESGLSTRGIERQMRAGHAWQFYKTDNGNPRMCDMHWHPVIRCYSPRVAEMFLSGAETVTSGNATFRIPCATDMLFHATAHGLQWSWTTPIRWIPDALFVLRSGKVDWPRLCALAAEVQMGYRVYLALHYLKTRFEAPVPAETLEALAQAPAHQVREQALMEKPNPLGLWDAARWHWFNFQRLRPFDPEWKDSSAATAFPAYLSVFFKTTRHRDVVGAVWDKVHEQFAGETHRPH